MIEQQKEILIEAEITREQDRAALEEKDKRILELLKQLEGKGKGTFKKPSKG